MLTNSKDFMLICISIRGACTEKINGFITSQSTLVFSSGFAGLSSKIEGQKACELPTKIVENSITLSLTSSVCHQDRYMSST